MTTKSLARPICLALIAALSLAAFTAPASARTFVDVGIGVPVYGYGPRYAYAPAYYPYPYQPVYYPAPAYAMPPQPVAYLPAPPTGPVVPTPDGRYCREYTSQVKVGNQMQPSYGTACQMPDGAWQIQS